MDGPLAIRQNKNYNFIASGQNLKKPVKVDFKLAGTDKNGRYYEWNILNEKISSNEQDEYVFLVSLNFSYVSMCLILQFL